MVEGIFREAGHEMVSRVIEPKGIDAALRVRSGRGRMG